MLRRCLGPALFATVLVAGLVGPVSMASANHRGGDRTPPITSLSAYPGTPNGLNGWYTRSPLIYLRRNEAGTTYYQWDVTNDSTWVRYSEGFHAPEGAHSLYYRSIDSRGNEESVKIAGFKVDTTAPGVTADVNPGLPDGKNGWYTKAPVLSLTSDVGSTVEYRWDDSNYWDWSSYQGPISASFGSRSLHYRAIDQAGNLTKGSAAEIAFDNKPPSSWAGAPRHRIVSTGRYSPVRVEVWWGANDQAAGSGVSVHKVQYKTGRYGRWRGLWSTNLRVGYFRGYPGKVYYFRVRSIDRAGNAGRWSAPTRIDVVAPYTGSYRFPVRGRHSFVNSWLVPRSGGRSHKGTDIFARKGTPTVAVIGGSVRKSWNRLGGYTVWLRGNDGRCYYYAHLSRYGRTGRVFSGTVIGYVGNTGKRALHHPTCTSRYIPAAERLSIPTRTCAIGTDSAGFEN